jgi:hypothetical protein
MSSRSSLKRLAKLSWQVRGVSGGWCARKEALDGGLDDELVSDELVDAVAGGGGIGGFYCIM